MQNIQQAMKKAQELQGLLLNKQKEFEIKSIEQQSGGGLVKVVITYKGKLEKIAIDPSLLNANEKEVLEDLIVAALNSARDEAENRMNAEMSEITGSLGLPAGFKLPF